MLPKKTPTSSLSATELLAKRVRYRTLAVIRRICSGVTFPWTLKTRSSPATRLPHEIVEMIIAYLTHDTRSLRACTLTCYSWYIAAVPHLHQTLSTCFDPWVCNSKWFNLIQCMHTLGLLPLVKVCWIRAGCSRSTVFSPQQFNPHILNQFLALTNVQELGIDHLNIPSFMPVIQQYFGHFLPTVHSLTLREPKGSHRQIIYFIGLFQHLEDLRLLYTWIGPQYEPVDDLTLVPPFTPPLQGWLLLANFMRVGLLKDMIDLLGGIQFRWVDFFGVDDMRLLLDGRMKMLETLRLYPTDPHAVSSLQDFDLSQNKSLRTLQVTARSVDDASRGVSLDIASRFLQYVLSTIQSPVFFQVEVLYRDYDLLGPKTARFSHSVLILEFLQAETPAEASRHRRIFEVFREVRKVRDFQLVLCAEVPGPVRERSVEALKHAIAVEEARNGFDDFFPKPLVTYHPFRHHW